MFDDGLLSQRLIQTQRRGDVVSCRCIINVGLRLHLNRAILFGISLVLRRHNLDVCAFCGDRSGLNKIAIPIDRKFNVRLITVGINGRNRGFGGGGCPTPTRGRPAVQMALPAFFNLIFNLRQQRLAVGDRQLVVIRVYFRKGQEPVTIAAIIHKSSLQRRFNPRHTRQIYVGFNGAAICRFVVNLFDSTINHNHDPGFITAGRVDKHFLAHHIS